MQVCCAQCGEMTPDAASCAACGQDPLLDGRYRLREVLGHGARASTYRAVRLSDGLEVAVKEMLLVSIAALKDLDLFDRIEYTFAVDGVRCKGSQFSYDLDFETLPARAVLPVLYDPDNPATNVMYLAPRRSAP